MLATQTRHLIISLTISGFAVVSGFTILIVKNKEADQTQDKLETTTQTVVQMVERAKERSEKSTQDSAWGVATQENKVTLYKGQDYNQRELQYDDIYFIPPDIYPAGLQEVTFRKVSGEPEQTGEIILNAYGQGGGTRKVTINSGGKSINVSQVVREKGVIKERGVPVTGKCGLDHQGVFLAPPAKLCLTGYPKPNKPVREGNIWTWACLGQNGGGTAECRASYGQADFHFSLSEGESPLSVQFTDQSEGKPTAWEWNFNEDHQTDSIEQNPTFTYTEAGEYIVSLKVFYDEGHAVKVSTQPIKVFPALKVDFYATKIKGVPPMSTKFYENISRDDISEWKWNFGDGYQSKDENPLHIYRDIGTYSVSLTVATKNQQIKTETKHHYIEVQPECTEGETRFCNTGDNGICGVGIQLCENYQWTGCQGNIEPMDEVCSNGIDENCDGQEKICPRSPEGKIRERSICGAGIYESGYCCGRTWQDYPCAEAIDEEPPECEENETRICDTQVLGICAEGEQTCINGEWGSCKMLNEAEPEICSDNIDQDCDGAEPICPRAYGKITERSFCDDTIHITGYCCEDGWQEEACPPPTCLDGETRDCATGEQGICSIGTQTCQDNVWGACEAVYQPMTDICSDNVDQNCNGGDEVCETCTGFDITQRCLCGEEIYSYGYCCFGAWSSLSCCGDGECGTYENCALCEKDCGVCPEAEKNIFYIHPTCEGISVSTGEPYKLGENCYTSLSNWETNFGGIDFGICLQGDLVCANKYSITQIEGVWNEPDTNSVTIDGWKTDADHFIKIYTSPEARHNGQWDVTAYRLEANNQTALNITVGNVTIEGIQISMEGKDKSRHGILSELPVRNVTLSHNIIKDQGEAEDARYGIYFKSPVNKNLKIFNNLIYGFNEQGKGGGIKITATDGEALVANNTVIDCAQGITTGYLDSIAKNNLVQYCDDGFENTFAPSSDYNISDLINDAPGLHSKNQISVQFMDLSQKNFHLSPEDLHAKDQGTSLTSEFSNDIDGEYRDDYWDIGADEGW